MKANCRSALLAALKVLSGGNGKRDNYRAINPLDLDVIA